MLIDEVRGRQAGWFTLQWHLTHACDMHCAHCYDRSRVSVLKRDELMAILDDYCGFCERRDVKPSVTLSGGNPFFHPSFLEVCAELHQREIPLSILGNPVPREQLAQLVETHKPRYYQISLEGLREHNDKIRGEGSYDRAMAFFPLLREMGVRSVCMLTLTSDNVDQALSLAEELRGKADRFTFNRLSATGEGAKLGLPDKERYGRFMVEWMTAKQTNPMLGFKDNLFNILRHELGMKLTGGCTGFGCGAAFNFVAVLPDGQVHACRKFPSKIGNLRETPLETIYDSAAAERYRVGCTACSGCAIQSKCGGCLAVTRGAGLDPFTQVDPYCFM